ncbi:monocarboxylate transporter 10 isoform X2 [Acomys russatus]|uniref:monocarboxylate transporter 10 isoform X2 n=1 Tax=Acomys russatus TaxID=60746 RepID=UPI0021E2DF8C|nr:monocarboxylate transporter 10 isoform X2 [Acomys russatus]
MVPSQEKPAAEREASEAQPPGSAPSDDAPLPGPGPSDGPDVSAEKVEVELVRSTGEEPPVPPDGGWGWLVMLAAMWCNGSVFGIQNAYGVLFVSMLDTFGAKDDENMAFKTAWVGSLSMGMIFFCCPIVSVFTDMFGCRKTAVVGAAVGFIGLMSSSFVSSIEPLYLTYGIIFACGCSFAYQPSLVILGHYFKKRLGLVNGIVTAGSSVFTILLPLLLGNLIHSVGFFYTLRVLCIFMFVLFLAGFTYRPLVPSAKEKESEGNRLSFFSRRKFSPPKKIFNFAIFKVTAYAVWAAGIPLALFGYFVPYVHLMNHVKEKFQDVKNKEVLFMCIGITSGVGRLLFGRIADYVPGVKKVYLQGMSVAILGPTFQDLAANVNRNISSLSLIFVGRATGFLCGTMIGGVLFDHMNQFFLLGMSMVATTVGLYLIPFCKTAVLLIVTMSVFGASVGVVDTGANVLILALWGDKGAPHMQALHFSFALGAFLAPLLAKLAWGTTASAQNHTESDFGPPMLNQTSEAATGSLFAVPDNMNLLWAYASIGTYILVVAVFLFGLFCKKRSRQKKSTGSAQGARRAKYHRALLCLLFLFFFFYVGAEITFGSYVFSFATTHVGMEESEAAGLNSVFWGTFAACRGLAIFFATFLQPGTMIVLSNIGSLTSSFFLVLFDKSRLCLWIATSVYGASMAATFPSGISWVEQYTSISGKAAAFFVIGASLGDMAIPAVIGILQGHYPDLPVVLYTCLGSAIFTAVLFPVMYKLATLPLKGQHRGKKEREDQKALSTSSRL